MYISISNTSIIYITLGMKANNNINNNNLIDSNNSYNDNNNINKRMMERRIEPAMKDRMARTMMLLLERQEAEQINLLLQSSYNQRPLLSSSSISSSLGNNIHHHDDVGKLTLLTCNVPLPASFYTASLSYGKSKGYKSILIQGLVMNIIHTIDEMKAKLLSTDNSYDPFMKSTSPLLLSDL